MGIEKDLKSAKQAACKGMKSDFQSKSESQQINGY